MARWGTIALVLIMTLALSGTALAHGRGHKQHKRQMVTVCSNVPVAPGVVFTYCMKIPQSQYAHNVKKARHVKKAKARAQARRNKQAHQAVRSCANKQSGDRCRVNTRQADYRGTCDYSRQQQALTCNPTRNRNRRGHRM